ncbi:MAG TPA: hypothetical protein VEO00_11055, partial [Actinomycetota bacterium]|nr:hypothetical protein [Actinomycetota bacterium]
IAELEAVQAALEAARTAAAKAGAAAERAGDDRATAEDALARAAEADPALPCPTCGRPLGDDFAEYVRHCRARLAEGKKAETAARTGERRAAAALAGAERAVAAAAKRGDAVRQAVERRRALEQRVAELGEIVDPLLERFGGEVPDVPALAEAASREVTVGKRLAELDAERRRLEDTERDLDSCRDELEAAAARLAELDGEDGRLGFDVEEHARLGKERDESRALLDRARADERVAAAALADSGREAAEAEGRLAQARETAAEAEALFDEARLLERVQLLLDGFRDHLVARVGPELSREAEALFRDLTGGAYEDLRIDEETMAIQIADGADWLPIERFSGSETDLANLALRVAISMHMSRVSGADVGLLVLDEVLASLDAERRDRFVQVIGGLSSRFNQILVITHADQVKDQFPAVIEVRPTGRRRSQAVLV